MNMKMRSGDIYAVVPKRDRDMTEFFFKSRVRKEL